MKVLLVQPPAGGFIGYDRLTRTEPLGLESLAGALPGHEVRLLDLRLGGNLETTLKKFRPNLCGISCSFTMSVPNAVNCARLVRRYVPDAFVIVGGVHPSIAPKDFTDPAINALAKGEGEELIAELASVLEAGGDVSQVKGLYLNTPDGQVFTGRRELISDLDTLPFPRRDLGRVKKNDYYFNLWRPFAVVETTRGCPHRCLFCSVWRFYQGKVRSKSPERVVEELSRLEEPYVFFTDDNFFGDAARAQRIAALIAERGIRKNYSMQVRADEVAANPDLVAAWHEVGLRHVLIGFEATSDEDLQELHKDSDVRAAGEAMRVLRSIGDIAVTGSFIVDPSSGPEDFGRMREYARRIGISSPQFSILTPLPGTALYQRLKDQLVTRNYKLFDFQHCVLPSRLPLAQFYKEYAGLYQFLYAHSALSWRKYWSLLKGLMRGRYSISQVRGVVETFKRVSDPATYLQAHEKANEENLVPTEAQA
ncbi:MAG: radical SAM protein [Thermoleophilia bacterium]|nr:radical SAM protein [Thermoleophilia bacterium]